MKLGNMELGTKFGMIKCHCGHEFHIAPISVWAVYIVEPPLYEVKDADNNPIECPMCSCTWQIKPGDK